jgi:hypothetical protein
MPAWDYRIDLRPVFRSEELTFEQRRDAIVDRLRTSSWVRDREDAGADLSTLVDELAEAADTDAFDRLWDDLYDEADADRAWIATF